MGKARTQTSKIEKCVKNSQSEATPPPSENQISVKKWTVLGDGSFCLLNLDSKTTLTFFGTYYTSSAINFAKNQLELTREGPLI